MRKWEDIVKDKLERYESNLPENSLAAFHARRAAAGATKAKRFPLIWAVVPAVAAGLAAVLLLRKPVVPEGNHGQSLHIPDSTVPLTASPMIAQATRMKAIRVKQPKQTETAVEKNPVPEEAPPHEMENIRPQDTPQGPKTDFAPQQAENKPVVRFNMGTGGTIAAGGGLLAALATQLAGADASVPVPGTPPSDLINIPGTTYSHRRPWVVGLSLKCPVTDRLGITTGLEYSLYASSLTSPTSANTQLVHYLGIPVRLDWTIVSGKWLEAYLGAGVKGDMCLGATLAGESIGKDGPAFRLLAAGGIQFNATRDLSFFIEPSISWTIPSDRRILYTYSSEHPWMFTAAVGVRINLGK